MQKVSKDIYFSFALPGLVKWLYKKALRGKTENTQSRSNFLHLVTVTEFAQGN